MASTDRGAFRSLRVLVVTAGRDEPVTGRRGDRFDPDWESQMAECTPGVIGQVSVAVGEAVLGASGGPQSEGAFRDWASAPRYARDGDSRQVTCSTVRARR